MFGKNHHGRHGWSTSKVLGPFSGAGRNNMMLGVIIVECIGSL